MISDLEKEYRLMNKKLFSIQNIDFSKSGTVILESYLQDRKKYYVNVSNFTIHTDYPTTKENEVALLCEYLWVLNSLKKFILEEETRLDKSKGLLTNILAKDKITQP